MMVDFHCHLDLYDNPAEVAEHAQNYGVATLSVTTTPSAFAGTRALGAGKSMIRTALGLHPELAHLRFHELSLFDDLIASTQYVGEVGLDGSNRFAATQSKQLEVFRHVLRRCADVGGRLLSVHSRHACREVVDAIRQFPGLGTPVLHWYTGGVRDLEAAIELDCWFSVGPAMVATSNGRRLVARMPPDRIVTESDGPFARGEAGPLHPWEVGAAYGPLSNIWNVDRAEVDSRIQQNFMRLLATGGGTAS